MSQILYSAYALIYLALGIFAFLLLRRTRWWSSLFLLFSALALLYDNGVLALGRFIGEGETLRILTVGRFCLHFAVTPFLLWVALDQARRLGHGWAGTRVARGLMIAAIAAQIIYGFAAEVHGIDLAFIVRDGIPRYFATVPTIASIVVPVVGAVFALIVGALLWRKNGWPWLFLGAVAVFLTEGVTRAIDNPILQLVENAGEVLYIVGYLLTERFISSRSGKD